MFLMDTLSRALTFAFLITSMLSVGMQATMNDLRSLLASKGLLFRALLANFVVVPIIGIVLVKVLPLRPEAAIALLLLACAPGGISALQFTTKVKGEKFFAGSSAFLMSVLAVFLSPVLLTLVLPGDISVVVPYGRALLFVVVFLLLPLIAGMLVCSRQERLAEKLSKLFSIVSVLLFVAVVLLIRSGRKEAMNAVGKEALLYMLLFIVLTMITGWLMAGRPKEARPVLATVTSMRNVALCLLIAMKTFPDPAVQTPLVAFSALMVPPNMLLTLYWAVRSKKKTSS
jgi:bile acid:Na+ symporter, BASS family